MSEYESDSLLNIYNILVNPVSNSYPYYVYSNTDIQLPIHIYASQLTNLNVSSIYLVIHT